MLIVDWSPITEIEAMPPMGDVLIAHLENYNGKVRIASRSAWNLLYNTMRENGLQVSTVSFTDTGKPFFLNSSIHFSISHSHGICAVAIADQPVGIDVEMMKESYNPHLIERSLSEAEKSTYDGNFTRLWCRKEAIAKMTGEGITGYPNYIDTTGYQFQEQQIDYNGQTYWLVATEQELA